ncbi:MAG: cytochrome c3 family protein [Desulfobacterales bacterium]|uniref:Cytochrome c3 family protein n=1 Tax=Candidatus Desulfaltia bathyphila TaxID=2841697 RepID=A0A8J6N7A3_9BACT|nr:cytochrome c3 family protein [Candidatus Desulfaltia bathyphila]MBL7195867.1 cytochrome c3 family protein [Desulfobacterales bacterium]MBL7207365.1 cytochrome c3 family protein [Desulfobacterales bacterium]
MKKNNTALFISIAGLAFLFILGVAYAQDDITLLEHDAFIERERPGAVFSHTLHTDEAEIDCLACHHIYENGENVWDDSSESECAACHKLEADGKMMPLMKAFHENCKGCHEKEKGPLTCGECHPR